MSLNAVALEVSDQEGDKLVTPIIDSITDGDFSALTDGGGGLSEWDLSYDAAWELGYSTLESLTTYEDWDLPTADALVEIRSLQDSGAITSSNGYTLLYAFDNDGGTKYWSSTEVIQTTNELSVPETPSIGGTLGGGKVYWVWAASSTAYIVADGWSSNLYANTWGCYGTEIDQESNNANISSGSANSSSMLNNCTDINTAAVYCEDFDNGYLGSWYLPSISALDYIYTSGLYAYLGLNTENKLYWSSTQGNADEAWVYSFGETSILTSSVTYNDWYLPSKDELKEMYNTIGNGGPEGNIGGFSGSWYWSSSEYSNNDAWLVYFGNGATNHLSKSNSNRVRAIRTANTFPSSKPIGDTHEGGIIFYKSGSTCLIAEPEDVEGTHWWGCRGTLLGVNGTAIGTGQQNTLDIISGCPHEQYKVGAEAAIECDAFIQINETHTTYTSGSHLVSKDGIMVNGQTQIFTRPVRHYEYNVVTPQAFAVNTNEYGTGFRDPEEKAKSGTYRIRPVKTVSVLVSEGVYNVGDSLRGGKVFHRVVTTETEGETQTLQIVANSDANSAKWNCPAEWNTTGMSVSGVAASAFATDQMRDSSCTGSTEATDSCDGHSEEGVESANTTWGLISNSASWQPIYIRQLCTHIGQDYILNITVENFDGGVLKIGGEKFYSDYPAAYDYYGTITTSGTYAFPFTSDSELLHIQSSQGASGSFTGVITSISLVHDNIIHSYENAVGIVFPAIHYDSNSIDLGSSEHSETQVLELKAGWNLFSLWIDADGAYNGEGASFWDANEEEYGKDIWDVMSSGVNEAAWEEVIIIKDNNGFAILPQWSFNGIGNFTNGQGYQVKVTNDCTFTFRGNPIHTEDASGNQVYGMTLVLYGGWNIIAAPWMPELIEIEEGAGTTTGYNAEDFFDPVIDDLIIAKNNEGNAYLVEWDFNGIGQLLSGQGYQVKMAGIATDGNTYYIDATYTPG